MAARKIANAQEHGTHSMRRTRPRVLVNVVDRALIELARQWQWDLVDLGITRGVIPEDPYPVGAILDLDANHSVVKTLLDKGCHVVRHGYLPDDLDSRLPAVLPDRDDHARQAVEHFAQRRFKHVAYVGYDPLDPQAQLGPLYHMFRRYALEAGMAFEMISLKHEGGQLKTPTLRHERRMKALANWLIGLPKPVGIFTYSDITASNIILACQQPDVPVPERVAVLGLGDNELVCELNPVTLSSVDTAADEGSRQAMWLVRQLIEGHAPPTEPIMVKSRGVHTRRSTDTLAVEDPTLARVLRFMWDHADLDLSVDDIAKEVGISRRSLQRAFQVHLGRGVTVEMRRRRLEKFKEALETTQTPVAELAPLYGFRTLAYMHQCFREAFDTTPHQYRARLRR
ncbi:MAG: helix-turn-helix domain-containing protein [Phycisphaera sp.]|nr:helix-turn-helix domain-containing protein [Phycisphaera sp.]